jgi:hypothetical protein
MDMRQHFHPCLNAATYFVFEPIEIDILTSVWDRYRHLVKTSGSVKDRDWDRKWLRDFSEFFYYYLKQQEFSQFCPFWVKTLPTFVFPLVF